MRVCVYEYVSGNLALRFPIQEPSSCCDEDDLIIQSVGLVFWDTSKVTQRTTHKHASVSFSTLTSK